MFLTPSPIRAARGMVSWLFCLMLASPVHAATISGGALHLNLDATALANLNGGSNTDGLRYLYVEEFLDQSFNNQSVSGTAPDPTPGTGPLASTTGLAFAVNGYAALTSPAGRVLQPSTLQFDGSDPGAGTGKIGLSGMLRLRSDAFGGFLTPGDFTLARESGTWLLRSHDPNPLFDGARFLTLTNVTESLVSGVWSLSGNLAMGADWGPFLGVATGSPLGTFTFETTVVPVPGAVWLFGSAVIGLSARYRARPRPR